MGGFNQCFLRGKMEGEGMKSKTAAILNTLPWKPAPLNKEELLLSKHVYLEYMALLCHVLLWHSPKYTLPRWQEKQNDILKYL